MDFFHDIKEGQKKFGEDIGIIINSVLLTVVYIFGVGFTFLFSKIAKKSFLDTKLDSSAKTYWEDLNLGKKKMEDYYRQF